MPQENVCPKNSGIATIETYSEGLGRELPMLTQAVTPGPSERNGPGLPDGYPIPFQEHSHDRRAFRRSPLANSDVSPPIAEDFNHITKPSILFGVPWERAWDIAIGALLASDAIEDTVEALRVVDKVVSMAPFELGRAELGFAEAVHKKRSTCPHMFGSCGEGPMRLCLHIASLCLSALS